MSKEGPKDRLEMVSREPTWAKKVPRKTRDGFKRANLGPPEMVQESQLGQRRSHRLEMVSREPTWAKKVPTID